MLRIVILSITVIALATGSLFAEIPRCKHNNRYGDGRIVAESRSTVHRQGREYFNARTGELHRRVLIYKQSGEFVGYSKLGRSKFDGQHRHYHR
ncbi:MAG: hypothetical protein HY815_28080 [Candidatus Riflebacteria bacterium]|nr:hypothetical protein [Candidatus Riflebacteria bacterium]